MQVNNIITSSNDSALYQSYWPHFAEVWKHFGIEPVLLWLTTSENEFPYPSPHGKIVRIPLISDVDEIWQSQTIRLLGLAAFEGINLSGDIDLFPLAQSYMNRYIAIPDSALAVRSTIQSILMHRRFGAAGIAGKQSLFQQVFTANGVHVSGEQFWTEELLSQMLVTPIPKGEWTGCSEQLPGRDELWFYRCFSNMRQLFDTNMGVFSIAGNSPIRCFTNRTEGGVFDTPTLAEFSSIYRPISDIVSVYEEIHYGRDAMKEVTATIVDEVLKRNIICA